MSRRKQKNEIHEDQLKLGEQITAISAQYEPDQAVKAATRFKLLQQITKEQENVTSTQNHRFNRQISEQPGRRFAMSWMFIAVTLLALAGGTGAVYASNDALPGDILYPVKIASEDMQLFFSNDESDADLLLSFMDERLEEMDALVEDGNEEALDLALNTYQNQLEQLTNLMSQRQPEDPIAGDALEAQVQSRLEEQAQRMLNINEEVGERLQIQLQTQDRTETQDQLQLKDGTGVEDLEENESTEVSTTGNQQNGGQSGEPQNQNQSQMSASLQTYNLSADDRLSLRFVINGQPSGNIYVRVNGVAYACSSSNGSVTCEGPVPFDENALIEVIDADNGTVLLSQWITVSTAQNSGSDNGNGNGEGAGGSGGKQH